jgi:biotin transport system substrate-specific component
MDDTARMRALVLSAAMAALTGVGAWIAIPIGPVPFTLQVLFVYLAGLLLPPSYAGLAMVLYVLLGIIGLPVFAGGTSGLASIIGPTGGYFVGFVIAAVVISWLISSTRDRSAELGRFWAVARSVGACLVGAALIFGIAAIWGKFATGLEWTAVLAGWVFPFLPGDVVKNIIASLIAVEIWRRQLLRGRYA